MSLERIYLDHNATTPVRPEVVEAMLPWFRQAYGNASSLHAFGREARVAIEAAREEVAALINAEPDELCFTSGATEADNLALKGLVDQWMSEGRHAHARPHLVVTAVEHEAILRAAEYLREHRGCEVTMLPVDQHGIVSPEAVADALTDRTAAVSVIHANNETGTIIPIKEIASVCRERGVAFHTDAVQSVGKIPVDVKDLGADMLSLSSHKLYGPKGVGALYLRRGVRFVPQQHGGAHERSRRAGTENVAGIVGLGAACRSAREELLEQMCRLRELRDDLERRIIGAVPDVAVNGHPTERLPGTLNVSFAGADGESIVLSLDLEGIAVSFGSACASGASGPSHVLLAMGLGEEMARAAVRFSFGRENTRAHVDRVMEVLPGIIRRIRALGEAAAR